jgi:hypothetical protein
MMRGGLHRNRGYLQEPQGMNFGSPDAHIAEGRQTIKTRLQSLWKPDNSNASARHAARTET